MLKLHELKYNERYIWDRVKIHVTFAPLGL